MEKQILQVVSFQEAFGIKTPTEPKMLTKKRATLRQKLIEEEVKELREAKNILEVSDALCDITYIVLGTAHEYGLADRFVMLFDEVHSSNMSKLGPDGKAVFRKDGKIMKPETYREPKLMPILERDFSLYKNNEIMKEIAENEKYKTISKIEGKIKHKLNWFDKIVYWLSNKLDKRLKSKIEVNYPQTIYGPITVKVYGKEYHIQNT
jgi:predicted HAD superfamily Cof-like phosphohydrolase